VQFVSDFIPIRSNYNYVASCLPTDDYIRVGYYDANKNFIRRDISSSFANYFAFTTPINASFVRLSTGGSMMPTLQLEENTTATPYSPYAVQVNKKPQKYVPKKNLWQELGQGTARGTATVSYDSNAKTYTVTMGSNITDESYGLGLFNVNTIGYPIKYGDSPITISANGNFDKIAVMERDSSGAALGSNSVSGNSRTYTPNNSNTALIHIYFTGASNKTFTVNNIQIEKSSTATNYEPFQLVLPKAKTGLAFEGQYSYFQLPSMTMDSVEIECLIDAVQPQADPYFVDARGGLSSGHVTWTGAGGGFTSVYADGNLISPVKASSFPSGRRTKIKLNSPSPFTDDVTIFQVNGNASVRNMKGILYKVTCYLNGSIVAKYDFENPRNIVGNQVIPNAQNLIPSFEDSRWSIHPNAKVMGKDVLHLDATANYQNSVIKLDVGSAAKFLLSFNTSNNNAYSYVQFLDGNNNQLSFTDNILAGNTQLNVPNGVKTIEIRLTNKATGSFDFIRPQLYQLTGQEGTLNGQPVLQLKHAKRRLYTKR
jgi:hypothetical protein